MLRSCRLDDDQAEELEAVAKADGVSVAEEIRQAITTRLVERREDDQFRARLRQSIEDNQRILERLAEYMAWQHLDLADCLLIAEAVLDVAAEDLGNAARVDLADSALHAPAAEFGGVEFYTDLSSKTAVLASRIIRNHPLPDGKEVLGIEMPEIRPIREADDDETTYEVLALDPHEP